MQEGVSSLMFGGGHRKVYILGCEQVAAEIQQKIASLNVFVAPDGQGLFTETQFHVVIAPVDFREVGSVRMLARAFTRLTSPQTHKIVYAARPTLLNLEQFVFCQALGASYLVVGEASEAKLKHHLKTLLMLRSRHLTCDAQKGEFERARRWRDEEGMRRLSHKLSELAKASVEALRLQVQVNVHLGYMKKAVFYLGQLLEINAQDLWALTYAAIIYLRANMPEAGLQFINEHSELGRYDVVRPQAGLVPCLGYLPPCKALDAAICRYLNARAALAVRSGHTREGLLHYQMALQGSHGEELEQAKILYNIGIAQLKLANYEEASSCLEKSLLLGSKRFVKAVRPLLLLKKIRAVPQSSGAKTVNAASSLDSKLLAKLDVTLSDIELL